MFQIIISNFIHKTIEILSVKAKKKLHCAIKLKIFAIHSGFVLISICISRLFCRDGTDVIQKFKIIPAVI